MKLYIDRSNTSLGRKLFGWNAFGRRTRIWKDRKSNILLNKLQDHNCVYQTLFQPNTVLTKYCIDQTLCRSSIVLIKYCVDQTLCRPNIMLTKYCVDQILCQLDTLSLEVEPMKHSINSTFMQYSQTAKSIKVEPVVSDKGTDVIVML